MQCFYKVIVYGLFNEKDNDNGNVNVCTFIISFLCHAIIGNNHHQCNDIRYELGEEVSWLHFFFYSQIKTAENSGMITRDWFESQNSAITFLNFWNTWSEWITDHLLNFILLNCPGSQQNGNFCWNFCYIEGRLQIKWFFFI